MDSLTRKSLHILTCQERERTTRYKAHDRASQFIRLIKKGILAEALRVNRSSLGDEMEEARVQEEGGVLKHLQKLMGPEGHAGAIKLIGGQEAPAPEASPRTAAAPPRSGHLPGRRHLARSSVPSPGDPPVILHTFASEMCRCRCGERRRALCRDGGVSLRSSHVPSRPLPAGPPLPRLRGCSAPLWSVLPGGAL